MYVSVDKEHLIFLHKHPNGTVVSLLAFIEAPHVAVSVFPCTEARDFKRFTDLELLKLYQNTTGGANPGFYRPGLEQICLNAVQALPETKAVAWEVDVQSRTIADGDCDRYVYVQGSMKPAPVNELFAPGLRAAVAPELVQAAAALRGRAAGITQASAAGIAPTGRDRPVQATRVAAPGPVGAAPRGGQREVIWACADKAWEAAGKPVAVPRVIELRKSMMDTLEAQGIKRTSASSELGNWMKSRVLAK